MLYTKINPEWIKDQNVRPKAIKLLEENKGSKILNINISNFFLDISLQARETRTKINKWDYRKIKSFCTVNETINKIKGNLLNGRRYLQVTYPVRV